jgi:chromosome segregation ATPase
LGLARAESVRQHALFKKAVDECERITANATHVQAELKTFQGERQQLKAEIAHARQAALKAEGHVGELAEALAAAQQEIAVLRGQEGDVNGLYQQISDAEARLSAQEAELRESQGELGKALRNLARTKSDLSATMIEAGGLRSQLEAHQTGLQTTGQQLHAAKAGLHDVTARFDALTEEHRVACEQRDQWQQRSDGFEHDLKEIDNGRELLEVRDQLKKLQAEHRQLEITLNENTESFEKNADVQRGIIARQNTTLGVYHSELRRLRRKHLSLRLVYAIFAVGLLALGFVAVQVFAPKQTTRAIHQLFPQVQLR